MKKKKRPFFKWGGIALCRASSNRQQQAQIEYDSVLNVCAVCDFAKLCPLLSDLPERMTSCNLIAELLRLFCCCYSRSVTIITSWYSLLQRWWLQVINQANVANFRHNYQTVNVMTLHAEKKKEYGKQLHAFQLFCHSKRSLSPKSWISKSLTAAWQWPIFIHSGKKSTRLWQWFLSRREKVTGTSISFVNGAMFSWVALFDL